MLFRLLIVCVVVAIGVEGVRHLGLRPDQWVTGFCTPLGFLLVVTTALYAVLCQLRGDSREAARALVCTAGAGVLLWPTPEAVAVLLATIAWPAIRDRLER